MAIKKKTTFLLIAAAILVIIVLIFVFSVLQNLGTPENDFSKLSWTDAFKKLIERMSHEYAFTEWKSIDWQKLNDIYLPRIQEAQTNNDFEMYYVALLDFCNEIPDGHVIINHILSYDSKYVGGGFGFAIAKLDDGRIIVTWVDEDSSSWKAGIRPGDELIEWDDRPIAEAVEAVSTTFAGTSATKENLECKKLQYLVRAPIGTQVTFVVMNQNGEQHRYTIEAFNDNGRSLTRNYPDSVMFDYTSDLYPKESPKDYLDSVVEKRIFDGIYYIKIWAELDLDLKNTGETPSTLELLRVAVQEANDQRCTGLILDLRGNIGGYDSMAADILGSFYSQKTFYEYQESYNYVLGKHEVLPEDVVYIEPAQQRFDGQIIALINTKCMSSGEGIAYGIENLPNGETLGFYGTNGSFGMTASEVDMPGNLTISWPYGRSLDENRNTQLDSKGGIGGVAPSIRVPMTEENAIKAANGEDVELDEALRILNS
jgi:carboxyl-terminal processing protease